jgi:hypothetical protein
MKRTSSSSTWGYRTLLHAIAGAPSSTQAGLAPFLGLKRIRIKPSSRRVSAALEGLAIYRAEQYLLCWHPTT